jgi:hypothetical protein
MEGEELKLVTAVKKKTPDLSNKVSITMFGIPSTSISSNENSVYGKSVGCHKTKLGRTNESDTCSEFGCRKVYRLSIINETFKTRLFQAKSDDGQTDTSLVLFVIYYLVCDMAIL